MPKCLICKKGEIISKERNINWYECTHCGADSNRLVDGILYPLWRRETLCNFYTPVKDLKVSEFKIGQTVRFTTVRNTSKTAVIIHIDIKDNQMIIEDTDTHKTRFVVDNQEIEYAYDALCSKNKRDLSGWWNRRIEIIGEE